jgi:predicted acyltransferase
MSSDQPKPRVHSMDQYRGYTVAGMFLVNFVGGISAFHYVLKHNSGFFSYADSIMPGFIFCAGFSYRLTAIRRFDEMGTRKACMSYVRRSLALVLVSVSIFTFNADIGNNWNQMQESIGLSGALSEFAFKFVKSGMWEVLSIIGMTQILLLPFIYRSVAWRVTGIIVLPLLHLLFSWSFNYDFANGLPNWFNSFFGAHNGTVWDGGLFGILAWSLPMLAGALTYDLISTRTAPKACGMLMAASLALMAGGYLTNCLSRLYDDNPSLQATLDSQRDALTEQQKEAQANLESVKAEIAALTSESPEETEPGEELKALNCRELIAASTLKGIDRKIGSLGKIALDPVIPSMERLRTAQWGLADLPFVKPEREKQQTNYWLMDKKRMVSLPFTLFSTGFGLFLYSLFIIIVDVGGLQLGVFRTLGQNPLAAYIIHEMLLRGFDDLNPDGSPLWWGILTFAVFFSLTFMMVRYLEKNRLFLRL